MTDKQILEKVDEAMRLGRKQALEQIRAEIEQLSTDSYITDTDGVTIYGRRSLTAEELKEQIFEIIDKTIKEQDG